MKMLSWLFDGPKEDARAKTLDAMSAVRDCACARNVTSNLKSKAASDAISEVLKRMESRRDEKNNR